MKKRIFTNKQWEELYSSLDKKYVELIKWLYDNHKKVLIEWEKTKGDLRIEFL